MDLAALDQELADFNYDDMDNLQIDDDDKSEGEISTWKIGKNDVACVCEVRFSR